MDLPFSKAADERKESIKWTGHFIFCKEKKKNNEEKKKSPTTPQPARPVSKAVFRPIILIWPFYRISAPCNAAFPLLGLEWNIRKGLFSCYPPPSPFSSRKSQFWGRNGVKWGKKLKPGGEKKSPLPQVSQTFLFVPTPFRAVLGVGKRCIYT